MPDPRLQLAVARGLSEAVQGRDDADPAVLTEARRLVFREVVARLARGRGDAEELRERWWIGAPPSLAAEEAVREAVGEALPDDVAVDLLEVVSAYEAALSWSPGAGDRQGQGAFYTPARVVGGLLDQALTPLVERAREGGWLMALRVCDPACGAGAFLIAVFERLSTALEREGVPAADARRLVAQRALYGVDVDAPAVELCRGLIWLGTALGPAELPTLAGLRVADSLLGATPALAGEAEDAWCRRHAPDVEGPFFHWHRAFPDVFDRRRAIPAPEPGWAGGFDLVVGNPPFLGQLRTSSARTEQARRLLHARFGGHVRGYADAAAAFLLLGLDLLRPGGRCTLVLPTSFLAARDTAEIRAAACRRASLAGLWIATGQVFPDASVFVCAPTLERGGPRRPEVLRRRDVGFEPVPERVIEMDALARALSWSPLVADLFGIPLVELAGPPLGDLAEATADFRDQFYGLRGFVVEDDTLGDRDRAAFPPLVTTGLVDPADCAWGRTTTRFDKAAWRAPRVDLARLEAEGSLGPWARSRLVPKVLLATQTRVLEAVVDVDGAWLPSTPLISVVPRDPARSWHLAAALSSPPITAFAAATWLGTALTVQAIKLSAAQVRSLPLPAEGPAWDAAAAAFRQAQGDPGGRAAHLWRCGERMCAAYGLTEAQTATLMSWWADRSGRSVSPGGSIPR